MCPQIQSGGFQSGALQGPAESLSVGSNSASFKSYHSTVDTSPSTLPNEKCSGFPDNDDVIHQVPTSGHGSLSTFSASPSGSDISEPFSNSPKALLAQYGPIWASQQEHQYSQSQLQEQKRDLAAVSTLQYDEGKLLHRRKHEQDLLAKAFMTDFMHLPDHFASDADPFPSNRHRTPIGFGSVTALQTSDLNQSTLMTTNISGIPASAQAIAAFDQNLDSPLGLEQSPFSEYGNVLCYDDLAKRGMSPAFEYSLFGASRSCLHSSSTSLMAPPPTPVDLVSHVPSPEFSCLSLFNSPVIASTSPTATPSGSTVNVKPTYNGFRKTNMLDLAAPIQSRTALLPSKTTKKRKTTAAEREIVKRIAAGQIEPRFESLATADELPNDVVAAVEKKRLQNTLSARKSRQRKLAMVQSLEDENEALREQNRLLMERIQHLESGASF